MTTSFLFILLLLFTTENVLNSVCIAHVATSASSRRVGATTSKYSDSTCITDPQKILDAELLLSANEITIDRYYYICKNSILDIMTYLWYFGMYVTSTTRVRPLSFIYPKAHILCGPDGDPKNNCTLRGGTLHVEVIPPSYFNLTTEYKIDNVSIHGFTFTGLGDNKESANIYIFGTELGADILVQDCTFVDNSIVSNIKFDDNYLSSVTVDRCIFKNNTVVNSKYSVNSGLIFSELGGSVTVKNSVFVDNSVNTSHTDGIYPLNAVITAIDLNGTDIIRSSIDIQDSCFIRNHGITSSLVLGSRWGDGTMTQKNNYAFSNSFSQASYMCPGIGGLYMNSDYYYTYYNFVLSQCQANFTSSKCGSDLNVVLETGGTVNGSSSSNSSTVTSSSTVHLLDRVAMIVCTPLLLLMFIIA